MFSMERHHASGWYALHYSDTETGPRPRLSSIYYLLPSEEPMPLHKLDGIEIWHFYKGAPAEMVVTNGGDLRETSVIGDNIAAGEQLQLAVPAHAWLSFRSLGDWTLLGCTMAPGYSAHAGVILNAD